MVTFYGKTNNSTRLLRIFFYQKQYFMKARYTNYGNHARLYTIGLIPLNPVNLHVTKINQVNNFFWSHVSQKLPDRLKVKLGFVGYDVEHNKNLQA